jgi:hypothetical protein
LHAFYQRFARRPKPSVDGSNLFRLVSDATPLTAAGVILDVDDGIAIDIDVVGIADVDAVFVSGSGAERTWRFVDVAADGVDDSDDESDDDATMAGRQPQPQQVSISQMSGDIDID